MNINGYICQLGQKTKVIETTECQKANLNRILQFVHKDGSV